MNDLPESAELFLDGARGIYIPRDFALIVRRDHVEGVSEEDWAILKAGPPGGVLNEEGYEGYEDYWNVWEDVLNDAVLTGPDTGIQYYLYQDGDLWLIPTDAEWPDPWAQDDLMDWDEQDARAAQEERLEAHRREQ